MFQRRLGSSVVIALACGFMLGAVQVASAQNVFVNPGFEVFHEDSGPRPTGWTYWDNVYDVDDTDNGVANSGVRKMKMFGNWGAEYNAGGIFQEFPAYPGDQWSLSAWHMVSIIDPLQGGNVGILKMEWYDAGGARLCGADWEGFATPCPELTVASSASTLDLWEQSTLLGTAMPGTAKVRAILLMLQVQWANGSVNFDDASLERVSWEIPTVSEWGLVVMALVGLAGGTMLFRRLSVA